MQNAHVCLISGKPNCTTCDVHEFNIVSLYPVASMSMGVVMASNRHERMAMVDTIVNDWIAAEEDSLGQIITDDNFGALYVRVEALRSAGKSPEWLGAITRWCEAIEYARKSFCDYNGFSCLANPSYSHMPDHKRHDFANRIKWAVMRGAIWAADANR